MTRYSRNPFQIEHPFSRHAAPRVKALVLDAQPFGEVGQAINALGSFFDYSQHEPVCRPYLPTLSTSNVGASPAGFAYQEVMETLGKRLRAARAAAKLTQQAVADHFGIKRVNVTQWEGDTTRPDQDRMPVIARLYGVELDWLMTAKGESPPTAAAQRLPAGSPRPPVPVAGWASGHEGADFLVRSDIQDFVPRPAGVSDRLPVYALYVTNTSMVPRFKPNDLLFVQQHKAPKPGDDVVIQVTQGPHDQEVSGYIKTFVRKTARKWICEQYNPKKTVEFDVGDVISVDRVIPWKELIGG